MNIRDIVNRDSVNLANCESEPIHIPGAIQPHGFLIGLKQNSLLIDYCSANAADFCGFTYQEILGKTFAEAFGKEDDGILRGYLESEEFNMGNPVALQLGATVYNCTVGKSGSHFTIEAEPFPDGSLKLPDLYRQTRKFVALLERTQTLRELCQTIAEETRSITGYDRVMVYRFDKDYNGEVIAEDLRTDLEPFLNLHYPHTDIPVQARELYLRNLLRMIVDVGYTPVPIYAIDDGADKTLDLSNSILRSVSPIHIEYLKNMGVGATLTISLIHEQKLWGLITCHHYTAKNLPHYTRLSAQLQGHFLTSQIDVRQASEAFAVSREISVALNHLLRSTTMLRGTDLSVLVAKPQLLEIANATGVAIQFYGSLYTAGTVSSSTEDIANLGAWLMQKGRIGSYVTNKLIEDYQGDAANNPDTAGLLYHSLTADGAHYIIWFRREQTTEVLWAGDPAKAIIKDAKGLSPRKSFEKWKEQTVLQSHDWSDAEQTAAATFANALQKQISLILITAEEQRFRLLSEQLQQANAELENINWISTHDLQEPLRKIRIFASRILDRKTLEDAEPKVIHAVGRMADAASRMQQLIDDIQSYSRLSHDLPDLQPISLINVLRDVELALSDEINASHATLTVEELPEISGDAHLLRQLFANLFHNSLKFARPDNTTSINVQYLGEANYPSDQIASQNVPFHCISVSDNGIGFSNEYADSIFSLFKRLHTQNEYPGTGLGLAICRRIMQLHNGHITAQGNQGEGAKFYLWFPS